MTIHSRFDTMWQPRYLTNCGQAVADAIVSTSLLAGLELAHVRLEVHYFNRYLVLRAFYSCSVDDAEGAPARPALPAGRGPLGLRWWPPRLIVCSACCACCWPVIFGQLHRSDDCSSPVLRV